MEMKATPGHDSWAEIAIVCNGHVVHNELNVNDHTISHNLRILGFPLPWFASTILLNYFGK